MDQSPPSSPISSPLSSGGEVGVFGKIPKVGDFVRAGRADESSRVLEEWLHSGVEVAHARRTPWKPAFLAGKIYGCVFRVPLSGDRSGLLAGVIKPSQDSVGRAFPLVIHRSLPPECPPHLLPLVLGDFLDNAAQLAFDTTLLSSQAELAARTMQVGAPLGDINEAARQYDWWTRNTALPDLWSSIYGSASVAEPSTLLGCLSEIVAPFAGRGPSTTPLSLRVPLGHGGVAAACFWLDLVRCSMRWRAHVPTFFWFFDGRSGDLLVQLGRTPPASLLELWSPDPKSDVVCDYSHASWQPSDDTLRRVAPHLVPLLHRHAYVAELLHAVWP